jgi:hypothetical protein
MLSGKAMAHSISKPNARSPGKENGSCLWRKRGELCPIALQGARDGPHPGRLHAGRVRFRGDSIFRSTAESIEALNDAEDRAEG